MPNSEYNIWCGKQENNGVNIEKIKNALKNFKIETPSWGYGNSGTRFKVFNFHGGPQNIYQKLDDAAQVHKYTGVCPSVAIHIPWDKADNYDDVKNHAKNLGLSLGAVNPNLFQEEEYIYGSLCNVNPDIQKKAIDHVKECVDIAVKTESKQISLWVSDGTNYPGQGSFRQRKNLLEKALKEIYDYMPSHMELLLEYKCFEPAFYHTDIADWGMSAAFCAKLGPRAKVLVDTGHHLQGANIEHIVAFLIDEGNMGGFHFNNKKYADDDLIVGSVNPYELFLIFNEIIAAENDQKTSTTAKAIAYMIDQSHCIEPKIPAMIRSVLNIQTAYAKALLVNSEKLEKARNDNNVMLAESIVREAFETDARPILEQVRVEMGLNPDPMKAYLESGYEEKKLSR